MTGTPDPRPAARIVDPDAILRKLLADRDGCRACGKPVSNGHHLIPKSEGGDDVEDNIIPVCGTGTLRCHGALHGNAYVYLAGDVNERRDAEWVRRRIGANLTPAEVAYVVRKLGAGPAAFYLRRHYYSSET